MTLNLQIVLAIAGCSALLIGLFGGGVKAKEIMVPKLSTWARIFSSLVGMILIGISIWLPTPLQLPELPTPTPIPTAEPAPTPAEIIPSLLPPTEFPTDMPTDVPTDTPTATQTPTKTPTNTPTYTPSPPPTSPPAVVEVFANQSWQGSGVYVKNDDSIQITYITGQWRARNDVEFNDPLGLVPGEDRIADPECLFAMLPSVAGDQALIAKIGENGEPFNPFKRTRLGEGPLYLRLNDCDIYLHDNSGSVTVRIQLIR